MLFYMLMISIFISQEKSQNFRKKVNNELKKVDHWVCANKLYTNYSKSNFLLMNNQNSINFSVRINHYPI